jgi:hypothetical protein
MELIVIGLIVFGLFMMVSLAVTDRGTVKARKRAIDGADATYADLFDGKPVAIYEASDATIPPDMVTEAADRYGYEIVSVDNRPNSLNGKTLTFRRGGPGTSDRQDRADPT